MQTTTQELTEEERRAASSLILLNPNVLIAQYKNSKALAAEAETYSKAGNSLVAKNRFESAAKLALYEKDLPVAKAYLEKALVIEKDPPFDIALSHFHNIARFVAESYKST